MKLQRKILLPPLLAFAFLILLLRGFILPAEVEQQTGQAIAQEKNRLSVIAPIIAEEILSGDLARIYEILENEQDNHSDKWASIRLMDHNGLLLFPLDPPSVPENIDFTQLEYSVSWSDQHLGQLILTFDISPVQQHIHHQIRQLEYLITGVIFILSLLAAIWNRRIVIKPVAALASAARELHRGNFQAPLPETSNDEIGELKTAFNEMRLSLLEAQKKSEEDNARLQDANQNIRNKNQALESALSKAESAAQAKSQFLAMMSHEIRTPMNGVLGMADILQDTELNDEQKQYLDIIQSSSESLLNILNDILDFSKMEAGQLTLSPIECDLEDLIERVCQLFASNARSKGLELIPLPAEQLHHYIIADATRLEQILSNLVSNAIKFTDEGRIEIRVRVISSDAQQCRLRFEIEDTGIGIPEHSQQKLFSKFVQADHSTTRQFGGTGLGLAICKQLTELMDGTIGLDSTEGQGTCVWLELPLDKGRTIPSEKQYIQDKNLHILAVDDIRTNLDLIRLFLKDQPVRVSVANSALNALDLLHQSIEEGHPVNLVITDFMMPAHDGFFLIRNIHHHIQVIPPVMMLSSANIESTQPPEGMPGADLYLNKPIRKHSFLHQINTLLKETSSRQAIAPIKKENEENHGNTSSLPGSGAIQPTGQMTSPPLGSQQPIHNIAPENALSILLVEDVEVNQIVVQGMLSQINLTAQWAKNGQEAVRKVREQPFDIILMDIQMPVMDGYEASVQIRQYQQDNHQTRTPIIALTAHAMKGDMDKCYSAGMDDYLTKPIAAAKLKETIEHWFPENNSPKTDRNDTREENSSLKTSSPEEASEFPDHLIQMDTLNTLQIGMGSNLLPIYQDYMKSILRAFKELDSALSEQDFGKISQGCRKIRESSQNLGLKQLSEEALRLAEISVQDPTQVPTLLKQLKSCQADTEQAINTLIS